MYDYYMLKYDVTNLKNQYIRKFNSFWFMQKVI